MFTFRSCVSLCHGSCAWCQQAHVVSDFGGVIPSSQLPLQDKTRLCRAQVHSNEGPALARALERLPRSLRELTLTSLDGLRTGVPLGMQLQGLTHVTSLTLSSRWGCAPASA